jgi:nucleotide-binding universal stress UspA family protein
MTARAPILVGVDPARPRPEALEATAALHAATGAPVVAASASGFEPGWFSDAEHAALTQRAQEALEAARAALPVVDATPLLELPDVAPALRDLAAELGAAALVLGPGHRGALARATVGGVVERLKADIGCPVVVAPEDFVAGAGFARIAVALDAGDQTDLLDDAAMIASLLGGELTLLAVAEDRSPPAPVDPSDARERVARAYARVSPVGPTHMQVLEGDPAQALIAASREFDLLICGSRRHGPLVATLVGSVTRPLLHAAACPVALVPPGTRLGRLFATR